MIGPDDDFETCPDCGCTTYVEGCPCPNCDSESDDESDNDEQ